MTVLGDPHDKFMPVGREVRIIQKSIRLRERILSDDIPRQTCIHVQQVDVPARPFEGFKPCDQLVQNGLYARFQPDQRGFRQVVGEDGAANPVELMAFGCQEARFQSEHLHRPAVFHAPVLLVWIDVVDHLGVIDVDLVRADPNDGACIGVNDGTFFLPTLPTPGLNNSPYLSCISQIFQV